ncbi:hypothetical protein ACPA9J_03840 [Pseudomonas aeruginosa]
MNTSSRNILAGLTLVAAGIAVGWGVAQWRAGHLSGSPLPTSLLQAPDRAEGAVLVRPDGADSRSSTSPASRPTWTCR